MAGGDGRRGGEEASRELAGMVMGSMRRRRRRRRRGRER